MNNTKLISGRFKYNKKLKIIEVNGPGNEIDCERSTMYQWLHHTSEHARLYSQSDIDDLYDLFCKIKKVYPKLPIFTNKEQEYMTWKIEDGALILNGRRYL